MSGVEREKIKTLIESREKLEKSRILILGEKKSGSNIIRNLFDKNFNEDDLCQNIASVIDLNIGKEANIIFSEEFENKKLNFLNYDCIICGISLLNKRVEMHTLDKIKRILGENENTIIVLTDTEFLDLREFEEMKAIISENIKETQILSVMDCDINSEYNEWLGLVLWIKNNVSDDSKVGFMKLQIVDNSFKNDICDEIVEFYINILEKLEVEGLQEADLVYIETNMVSEILSLYPHGDSVREATTKLVERTISKIVSIKKSKIEAILRAEEEARLAEEERLRAEEEARLAEEKRIKAEEEERRIEEERIKEEQERIRKEEEKRKKEEEQKLAEEKRIWEELEKIRLKEEAARAKAERERIKREEERLRQEEEKRIRQEEERIREEEERLREEERLIREEEEERIKAEAEKEKRKKAEEKRKKVEAELKIKKEALKKQRTDLIELRKFEEERKILNEKIKKLNRSLRKNAIRDSDSSIEDMIIEASFTVDDSDEIQIKHAVNEMEISIDGIIEEAIATKMEELIEQVRNQIKEKLKDSSII
ncbi:MAG: hypothetical protein ACRC6T_00880 [Sarcina sp.]